MTPAIKLATYNDIKENKLYKVQHGKCSTYAVLLKEYSFNYKNEKQTIPAGFISDGASIPRIFWRLLDPPLTARTFTAQLKHDFAYQTAYCTKKEADTQFLKDMLNAGYPRWKAYCDYAGVRLFGWIPWKKWRGKNAIGD